MTQVFYTKADGDEHSLGHALAKYALKRFSDSAAEIIFIPNTKPYVTTPGLFVSLSHSLGVCAAAVSNIPIGLDIELNERSVEKTLKLAERFFAPDELEYVRLDPLNRFFELWCKKESYVKLTGEGFSRSFKDFSVFKLSEHFSSFYIYGHFGCICSSELCEIEPIFVHSDDFSQYL